MAIEELKPCPFCGQTRTRFTTEPSADGVGKYMRLECIDCRSGTMPFHFCEDDPELREHLRERWNRRAQLEQASALVTDERAAFVTWADANGFQGFRESMFAAWQARALLSTQASAKEAPAVVDGEILAYRLMHRRYDGNWDSDGRPWCDGTPDADLIKNVEENPTLWRIDYAYSKECARKAGDGQAVGDEMKQAIGTLRWMLNISEDRPEDTAKSMFDETFSADKTTNRQHLEWLCAHLQSATAAPAAVAQEPVALQWNGLADNEKARLVEDICDLGTGFVVPLFAVIDNIEQTLRERNSIPTPPAAMKEKP